MTTKMTTRRRRPSTASAIACSLLLAASPSATEAFSSAPSTMASTRRTPAHATRLFNALEGATEQPEPSLADALRPDLTPSESPAASSAAAMPTDAIQSRTLDKNTLLNASLFLFAIGLALERVLSVDVGITRGWNPAEIAERIPMDAWRSYNHILSMAPLQTKAVTSATVYTIGDIIAQTKEGNDIGTIDRWRTLRSLLAGYIGHGPMSHVWYHVSEDFFDNVLHLHAWWDFVPKVVVDQAIFGPIWNNSYILLLGLMQLQKPGQIFDDMKRTTVPLIVSGLKLWPFVHCITYGLIPVENRLLWVDAIEIIWVTILAGEASGNSEDVDVNSGSIEGPNADESLR